MKRTCCNPRTTILSKILAKSLRHTNLTFAILFLSSAAWGQIGINTINPNPNAILDINGNGSKGFLFPTIANVEDENSFIGDIQAPNPTGIIFYNTYLNRIRIFDGTNFQTLNPWQTNTIGDIITFPNRTGKNTIVVGNKTLVTSITTNGTTTNTIEGYGTIPKGGIIMWSGDPSASFDLSGPNYGLGKGTLDGWALCISGLGTKNGIAVPDLSGRFIVGYLPNDPSGNYNSFKASSSTEKYINLQESNLPHHDHAFDNATTDEAGLHVHPYKIYGTPVGSVNPNTYDLMVDYTATFGTHYTGYNLEYEYAGDGSPIKPIYSNEIGEGSSHGNTKAAGGKHSHNIVGNIDDCANCTATPIDKRPPYYVLAFIIRIK